MMYMTCMAMQHALLTLGVHAQRGLQPSARMRQRITAVVPCVCVCVCVFVCVFAGANLWTGTSRHLTEGTSGLSGTFFTKIKRRFSLKTASLESTRDQASSSPPCCSCCNVLYTSPFQVRKARAIMVPRKLMRVLGYSMCTRIRAQTTQQSRTLNYSPIEWQQLMLVSFVQAVVACNATVPRVCTLVLFIVPCVCLSVSLSVSPQAILAVHA